MDQSQLSKHDTLLTVFSKMADVEYAEVSKSAKTHMKG